MESRIRFLTMNTGMRSDLAGLLAIICDHKPDVVFLQEIRLSDEELDCKLMKIGYKGKVNKAEDDSKPGIAIVWRQTLQITEVLNIVEGRAQLAILGDYCLMNLYAPSGSNLRYERNLFFGQDIFGALNLYPRASWVIAGDFNCLVDPKDVENGIGFSQKHCPSLSSLIRVKDLVDIFRTIYPSKAEFTFFRPHVAPSRLDRIYLSSDLKQMFLHVSILLLWLIIVECLWGSP